MTVPFANYQLKVFKLTKSGRISKYSASSTAIIKANMQQATLEEVALGLNSAPTGREWTIRTSNINQVEVNDQLIDQDGSVYFVKAVQKFRNLVKHDQILGVQDGV